MSKSIFIITDPVSPLTRIMILEDTIKVKDFIDSEGKVDPKKFLLARREAFDNVENEKMDEIFYSTQSPEEIVEDLKKNQKFPELFIDNNEKVL